MHFDLVFNVGYSILIIEERKLKLSFPFLFFLFHLLSKLNNSRQKWQYDAITEWNYYTTLKFSQFKLINE